MQNASNSTVPTNSSNSQEPGLPQIFIVYITMGIVVIAINATVIYLFATRKYLQTSLSNIFLFSLALSDLCYGLVTLPLSIACSTLLGKLCFAYYFFMIFTGYLTVYNILLGIIEKFFAICFTIKHHIIFTRSLVIKLCISVWIMSAVIAHIPQWWFTVLNHSDQQNMKKKYDIFQFVSVFVIPVIASATMYTMVLCRVSKQFKTMASIKSTKSTQQKRSFRLRNERKTALILALVFTVFVVCWSGWFVVSSFPDEILSNSMDKTSRLKLIRFVLLMRIFAAILNPILYTFIKNDFRKAFRSLGKTKSEISRNTSTKMALLEKADNGNQKESTL